MGYPLDVLVRALIEGRYEAVRLAPPLWSPDAIDSYARRILSRAARPPFSDPRHIARALGYTLLPRAPHGMCGEGTAPGVIAYDGAAPPKLRGFLVSHGVSHLGLARQPDEHNETDAWLLSIAIVLPAYETHPMALADIVARAWAPEWAVRSVMGERRGWFPAGFEQSSAL